MHRVFSACEPERVPKGGSGPQSAMLPARPERTLMARGPLLRKNRERSPKQKRKQDRGQVVLGMAGGSLRTRAFGRQAVAERHPAEAPESPNCTRKSLVTLEAGWSRPDRLSTLPNGAFRVPPHPGSKAPTRPDRHARARAPERTIRPIAPLLQPARHSPWAALTPAVY